MIDRYTVVASVYDVISGEWPVYRAGRVAGIRSLKLRPGETVLDLGCGTGLNLELLVHAVGPDGLVLALDQSAAMLRMARRRARRRGWTTVRFIQADAASFGVREIGVAHVNAVLATYSLSVMAHWRAGWRGARSVLAPHGRASIVDMALPQGKAAILSPFARLACALGGSDIHAHPWQLLDEDGVDVEHRVLRGGHIHAVTATVR